VCGGPTLLLVLDLEDPELACLRTEGIDELPLASHLDCSIWWEKQVFQFDPAIRTFHLVQRTVADPEVLEPEYRLPNPLPERSIRLRRMMKEDMPLDEEAYARLTDNFFGGPDFIRVLGPPLWIQNVSGERCRQSHLMHYIASIGHEAWNQPGKYLDDRAFFYGEGALYFFYCPLCRETTVLSQGS
jgi:hypothetical protein